MTNKEILKGIANLVSFSKKVETVKFAEIKLKDGSILNVDKLEVDGIVTDAEQKPVVAGTYELEDGTSIVVDETGKITEVKKMETEEVKTDETVAAAEVIPAVEPSVEIEDEVKPEDAIANLNERLLKVEQLLMDMGVNFSAILDKFSKIENEPAVAPVQFAKVEKKFEEMNSFEKFMYYRNK